MRKHPSEAFVFFSPVCLGRTCGKRKRISAAEINSASTLVCLSVCARLRGFEPALPPVMDGGFMKPSAFVPRIKDRECHPVTPREAEMEG